MRYRITILLLLITFISCKEETTYRMQILIQNETENKIAVQLFPKPDYVKNDLYLLSDLGNGSDYSFFDIENAESSGLFITSDIGQEPGNLTVKIFDSIYVIPFNEDSTIIKFYPDSVFGYSENIFDENSTWVYEKSNYNERDNFNKNPVESYNYSFIISTDGY